MKKRTVTFIDNRNGKKFEFNIRKGSSGPDVVDLTTFFLKLVCFYMTLGLHLPPVVHLR